MKTNYNMIQTSEFCPHNLTVDPDTLSADRDHARMEKDWKKKKNDRPGAVHFVLICFQKFYYLSLA